MLCHLTVIVGDIPNEVMIDAVVCSSDLEMEMSPLCRARLLRVTGTRRPVVQQREREHQFIDMVLLLLCEGDTLPAASARTLAVDRIAQRRGLWLPPVWKCQRYFPLFASSARMLPSRDDTNRTLPPVASTPFVSDP